MLFVFQQPKTNSPPPLYVQGIAIGKRGICSLIVWLGRWIICPVFSNFKQFSAIFSLLSSSIEDWMPIKCQRVSEQKGGAKDPGSWTLPLELHCTWPGGQTNQCGYGIAAEDALDYRQSTSLFWWTERGV